MTLQYTKPVILLRHADAINDMGEKGEVSDAGLEHALQVANRLDAIIQDRKLLIMSSPAVPAIQTTRILKSKLKRGDIVQDMRLFTDFDHYPHESWFKKKVGQFMKSDDYGVLLVVTHSRYFTNCFSEFGFDISLPQHGNGYLLYGTVCESIN